MMRAGAWLAALALAAAAPATAAAPPSHLGPEGVPIPTAPGLAAPLPLTPGKHIDGITCQGSEQVVYHVHEHLTVFVDGKPRQVPAGIGMAPPYSVVQTPVGIFVEGARCFMWLHTHAADGIIHTESPTPRTYTLGDFFDVWGQPLTSDRVGPARGRVTAFIDGRIYHGSPRNIRLLRHAQIQLDVGSPVVAPVLIRFPKGL